MAVKGLTTPFIALVARFLIVRAGTRDLRVVSYWIDTLVLKNRGKYLCYFAASSLTLWGKPTQCSRGSKKNFWRRCRGGSCKSRFDFQQWAISGAYSKVNIPSTHHIPLSPALHYLPFASRFPLPHFTLSVLFALSLSILPLFLYLPLFARLLFVCLCVSMALPRFGDLHLKRLEEIENNVRSFMVFKFEHNSFFRNELKEQFFYEFYE